LLCFSENVECKAGLFCAEETSTCVKVGSVGVGGHCLRNYVSKLKNEKHKQTHKNTNP